MKRHIGVVPSLLLLVLSLSSAPGNAVTITITEPGDGPPAFTILNNAGNLVPCTALPCLITHDNEILGISLEFLGITVPSPGASIVLDEPAADPFNAPNSDVITLFPPQGQAPSRLLFQSDLNGSVQTFLDIPIQLPHTLETGGLQTLNFGVPISNPGIPTFPGIPNEILTVIVQSDLATPEIPEPSTLLLLGSGLAGIAVLGRKRLTKKAQRPQGA